MLLFGSWLKLGDLFFNPAARADCAHYDRTSRVPKLKELRSAPRAFNDNLARQTFGRQEGGDFAIFDNRKRTTFEGYYFNGERGVLCFHALM